MNEDLTQEKLDEAFSDLLHEIAAGVEYQSALWIITHRHKVPGEALQEMYDAQ